MLGNAHPDKQPSDSQIFFQHHLRDSLISTALPAPLGARRFCISQQGAPHQTCNPPPPMPPPHQHPSSSPGMQRNHTRADLRAHVPSATGRDGERGTMPSTAQRFPSLSKLFPPAGPKAEVSLWWAAPRCSANSTRLSLATEIIRDRKANHDLCNSSI